MIQGNRSADQSFQPSDHLYFRCTIEDLVGDRINPARIRTPNTSVNWSKYSKPWDVVFDYKGFGIVRFVVRDLPVALPKNQPADTPPKQKLQPHSFQPGHVPEPLNYSHSELWTFVAEQRANKKLPETVKKELRTALSDIGLILHPPEI